MPRRIVIALVILIIVGAVTAGYARWVEPRWIEVTRHTISAPIDTPLTIAHITDLHSYGTGPVEQRMLDLLEREKPDAIVLTGDSIDVRSGYDGFHQVLTKMRAPLGVWIVRGNHENWHPVEDESSFYQSAGVRLLVDASARLRDNVWLVGLNDSMSSSPHLQTAINSIPPKAYTIALFHSPAYFDEIAGKCDLALAGHTHGGQVRLPFIGPLWLPPECGAYVNGWYERNGSRLYVSRGLGTCILPIRFWCRPELAIFTVNPL